MRIYLSVLILLTFTVNCLSAPSPAIVPAPSQWTIDVVYQQPAQITVKLPGVKKPQRFWYLIITATNKAAQSAPFYPKCELMTDTFQVLAAYKDTTGVVFKAIKKRHQKRYPFLESMEQADNKILQGSDNTKDFAIIWPDFDAKAKKVSLFIAGLSNETVAIKHPTKKTTDGSAAKVYLRKTLKLDYAIGGDEKLRAEQTLKFKTKSWVMR